MNPKYLAFYLPQYHPIAENNKWWGEGFTEWTNVAKARPLFPEHYQPHLPSELGFYDLRLEEARALQASLAQDHGIDGFCYYHYWFNEKQVLERPFNAVLESKRPNFPFCLCWANEDWTRAWDGRSGEVLLHQEYSEVDDVSHIASLLKAFADPRYIKVDGRPMFIVYRAELLPNAMKTADIWRSYAQKAGFPDLYLVQVESFRAGLDPKSNGFDAAIEFAPDWRKVDAVPKPWTQRVKRKIGLSSRPPDSLTLADYDDVREKMLAKPQAAYKRFPGVCPGFDNTPRRGGKGVVLVNTSPEKYADWLRRATEKTIAAHSAVEQFVFINAWNEWGEGNHLEPDQKWQRQYLEATRRVKTSFASQ